MKTRGLALVITIMLFLGTESVWAYTKWVPSDPFYTEHKLECTTMNREYRANGPNGKVILYESPVSSKVMGSIENGENVLVDYVYTNDQQIEWGFCEIGSQMGWIPMPYMVLLYDYISFEEEYKEQIQDEKGKVKFEYRIFETSDYGIEFWMYPGSEYSYRFIVDRWGNSMPEYTKTFVDEDGRKWGFVGYYLGDILNRWICISSITDLFLDYNVRYPNGGPQRDKTILQPYQGEEIFPDDYEMVQEQLARRQKQKKAVMVGGSVVFVVVAVLFYWALWKKIKQA